ncbi:MAG: hypothetical protein K6E50_10205 [Lachnospiraceae bacterium]|nr:hypothetical protein [Lachnospiraceae bacterium]
MKRKDVLRLLAGISASLCMTACSAAGTVLPTPQKAEATEETGDEDLLMEAMEQVVPSHSSSAGKSETVYVLKDADGDTSQVIVSDQLKNRYGDTTITDSTELDNITNVNGYGDYSANSDGTITWEADGSDVFYRGTTEKELPLDVNISYELDGVPVSAEEIAGKSGHVTICLDYENKTSETVTVDGEEYEVSVPFAVMSGMLLPNDHFSNVEAENGRVINEGSKQIVVGLAYPGLRDSLDWDDVIERSSNEEAKEKLEEVNFPEYVRIDADVTDFELGMTVTLAGCDLLQQADVEDGLDLSEVQDKMNELRDGSQQLVDGSAKLKDGSSELLSGSNALADGSRKLTDGAAALSDGAGRLYDGTASLKDGADTLYDGAESLKNGTSDLYKGSSDLKDGSAKLSDGAGRLYDGVVSYTDGAKSISDGADKLADGTKNAKEGADKLRAALSANDIRGNAGKISDGAAALSAGIAQLESSLTDGLANSSAQMQQAATLLGGVASWMGQTMDAIDAYGAIPAENLAIPDELAPYSDVLASLCGKSLTDCQNALISYNSLHYAYVSAPDSVDAAALANACASCRSIAAACEGEAAVYQGMIGSLSELGGNAGSGIAALKEGAENLAAGAKAFGDGIGALADGVDQLGGGLDALSDGADKLSAGVKTLVANNGALIQGASDLKDGARALSDGAGTLCDGTGRLNDGASALYDGIGQLRDGAGELKDGAGSLKGGCADLYDGSVTLDDGIGKLNAGMASLDEGVAELRDGMIRLDEEGIQEITKLLGDNAAEVLNRFKAVKEAGKNYTSFSGALDDEEDADNSVRFIYKTGAVSTK